MCKGLCRFPSGTKGRLRSKSSLERRTQQSQRLHETKWIFPALSCCWPETGVPTKWKRDGEWNELWATPGEPELWMETLVQVRMNCDMRSYWPVLAAGAGVFSVSHWFMSILLRGHGFTGIQKAVVDQAGSTPRNSDHNLCWCKFGFGKCFRASSRSSHWAGRHRLLDKIHFSLNATVWLGNG